MVVSLAVLLCIAALLSSGSATCRPPNLFNEVDECKRLQESDSNGGFDIPGLPDEVDNCIKEADDDAICCILKEHDALPTVGKKSDPFRIRARNLPIARLTCLGRQYIKDCMAGVEVMDAPQHTAAHDAEIEGYQPLKLLKHPECWHKANATMQICLQQAREVSPRFKICSGFSVEGANEQEKKWYNLVKHNDYQTKKLAMDVQDSTHERQAVDSANGEAEA